MPSFLLVLLLAYISILLALTFWQSFGEELDTSLEKWPLRLYCLSLSIACLFALCSSFNILMHFYGVTLGGPGVFLASLLLALALSWRYRRELALVPSVWSLEIFNSVSCLDGLIRSWAGRLTIKSLLIISAISLPLALLSGQSFI